MIKLFFTILVISIFQIYILGQDICAEIVAENSVALGESVVVSIQKKVDVSDETLKYKWSSSFGTVEILNSPYARIKTDLDNPPAEITVTLEVDGLPPNCLKSYQKKVQFYRPRFHPDRISTYSPWRDHKIRLTGMVEFLKGKENLVIVIRISTKNAKSKRILQLKRRMQYFLTNTEKINKERIKIFVDESAGEDVEYFAVTKDKVFPF